MIVTTIPSVGRQRITRRHGTVTGEAILGANLRVLFASVPASGTVVSLAAV